MMGEKDVYNYMDKLYKNIVIYIYLGLKFVKLVGFGEYLIGIIFGYRVI